MQEEPNPDHLREINREIVSGLITSKDNKVLMGQKDPSKGGVYSDGYWHLPGGGVDGDESDLAALRREVIEETGVDMEGIEPNLMDDQGEGRTEKILKDTGEKVVCNMHFNVYSIQLNDDAADINLLAVEDRDDLPVLEWFDFEDLKNIKLTPPSRELFKRLGYLD